MKVKVFLGGTCNESTWRDELIALLSELVDYFNPVVDDWTPECQKEELRQRTTCDYVLYVITSEMTGVYSIAEAVEDSNKRPSTTLFCYLDDGFTSGQIRSLASVARLISKNSSYWLKSLEDVAEFLNTRGKGIPMDKKPTIAELEDILDKEEDVHIEVLPNGEIRSTEQADSSEPGDAKPITMRESLGGEY